MANELSRSENAATLRSLRDFQNHHLGEAILVCGCGSSLAHVVSPERTVTIGVNDVGRLFDPDYLVVVNRRAQFSDDRFTYIENSRAKAIFTQLELGISHPNVVRFQLGQRGGTDFANPDVLPYTRNSPYVALCLAVHMGARRVGLIGVDFTSNHFFGNTGQHALSSDVYQIDREYQSLYARCARMGVEILNLSPESRLTAFPKVSQEEFFRPSGEERVNGRKVFFVNYQFLSCGSVFSDGLAYAADQLGIEFKSALWDKPHLEREISEFSPDLVFAVHGRKFTARHRTTIEGRKSAVWLLDEPYEVDDTSRFSASYQACFINDLSTVKRHRNAHYLPVCYDPGAHYYRPGEERPHVVGFIGGFNPAREEALLRLAKNELLSYVVGGPWLDRRLLQLCISKNIPASETAELYRQTRIVINVFRTEHHFNKSGIAPVSLNPRIYEALQCGALVISEHREEIDSVCPELPIFKSLDEMELQVQRFLGDEELFMRVRKACIRRLASHSYANRLARVLKIMVPEEEEGSVKKTVTIIAPSEEAHLHAIKRAETGLADVESTVRLTEDLPAKIAVNWEVHGRSVTFLADETIMLTTQNEDGPGSEQGLVSRERRNEIVLEFEVFLELTSRFIAKVHLEKGSDQSSNSYHLMCEGENTYLARHQQVLARVKLPVDTWIPLSLSYNDGMVVLRKSGVEIARAADRTLPSGYCFLGVKGGSAQIRNAFMKHPLGREVSRVYPSEPAQPRVFPPSSAEALHARDLPRVFPATLAPPRVFPPRRTDAPDEPRAFTPGSAITCSRTGDIAPLVSIITTVYDRVNCLEECLRSVSGLEFHDYEHIIVADQPPAPIVEQIRNVIAKCSSWVRPPIFACLRERRNNWGIAPAARGLEMSRGKYVCFLSDDNGYEPSHFNRLVMMLEGDPDLGFVYSSCRYDGRFVLRSPVPKPGGIDLGQPLFRRDLFDKHLGGTLPFAEYGWDWRMIEHFMQRGVRWQHLNEATFLFRLAKYRHLMAPRDESGISYCIACFRPRYAKLLISDLIAKTTASSEILVWLNVADAEFEAFLEDKKKNGADIRVIGRTPENAGMTVYPHLFAEAKFEMIVQIDDDVVSISPRIAESAHNVFQRFPNVGMLTADVWQDEYTTGARPPMHAYRTFSEEFGLYDGPIDGWFAVYRKTALSQCRHIRPSRYFCLGLAIKSHLNALGKQALLCTRMRVFHVVDPTYVDYFGMLDSEIEKYRSIGRNDQVERYTNARRHMPPREETALRVQSILASLESTPG